MQQVEYRVIYLSTIGSYLIIGISHFDLDSAIAFGNDDKDARYVYEITFGENPEIKQVHKFNQK